MFFGGVGNKKETRNIQKRTNYFIDFVPILTIKYFILNQITMINCCRNVIKGTQGINVSVLSQGALCRPY